MSLSITDYARLEDTVRLALPMWAAEPGPFEGHRLRLPRPVSNPAPLTRPHPPILIGGTGEQRTLPLVARCADARNLFDIPDDGVTIKLKLAVLAQHCHQVGRSPDAIEKTISTRFDVDESPREFTQRLDRSAALGLDHAVVITSGPWTERAVEQLGTAAAQVGGS